ncbi:unnamed protein product [Kluyveromyces dobzhanskii CBS 2104]|uniref:WGS project CCBQ000000000 data, contig 00016 n=1 Tax=Kluyveromyces dobzhanskii CBS 2104 TaxID=1427455 RepID=A0A0A8KZQ7_9SACH|nr:unnamed protein product [Kluyveromyces dobzhanskii CBS 2104]
MDVYDRIHTRQPVRNVVQYVAENDILFDADEFLQQLDIVLQRNKYYAKQLLKELIRYFEQKGSDFAEVVYEPYIDLLPVGAPGPQDSDVIQYRFGEYKVAIEETPSMICAQGTTGFRTWEAALFLCHYMTENPGSFSCYNGAMLELGCGTGIISILYKMMKDCQPETKSEGIIVTDGDSNLLQQVSRNFRLNGLLPSGADSTVRLQRLRWNDDELHEDEKVDLVLAADVTYDTSVIPDLVACLSQFKGSVGYVSCTERNLATLDAFENELEKKHLAFEIVSSISPTAFQHISERNISTRIRIYKISIN